MIALAFSCDPQLLIADEPTTALDVTVQRQVLLLLREKARQRGTAILLITHDMAVVSQFCDRVYVMYTGAWWSKAVLPRSCSTRNTPTPAACSAACRSKCAPASRC